MRRCLLVVGAAAVCLTADIAAPAAGAQQAILHVSMSGMVSAVWDATPARGCATAGTCGISGSVTYRTAGFDMEINSDGSSGGGITLEPTVVRVRQEGAAGPPQTCVDVMSGFTFPPVTAFEDTLEVNFLNQELSAGRCAGPRPGDLVHALPGRSLRLRSVKRVRVLDLSGRFPFVAGSFSGHVISTVAVTVRRVRARSGSLTGPFIVRGRDVSRESGPPRRRHAVLRLLYRAGPVSGTVLTSFRGRVQPACQALGACGTRGTSAYDFAAQRATVEVFAFRPQRRGPARRQTLLRALRRGTLAMEADAKLRSPSARVRQAVAVGGGAGCSDAMFVGPPELLARRLGIAPYLSVYLRPRDSSSYADTLRARCAGPTQGDVLPGEVLARGRVDLGSLGLSALPVTLQPTAPAFLGEGYSGERSGGVPLGLRLVATDARIERF